MPIVFAGTGDPVGQGFVASLARPGGNITGFAGLEFTLAEKWVSFLKELAPGVTRIAYLFHLEIGPYYALWLKSVEAAAATLGVETSAAPVRAPSDIEQAISAIAVLPDGGLIVQPDGYTVTNRRLIIELAARHRLPAVYTYRYDAVEGGLVSYGADILD
jgi:putative ABC transport system substrate-binding protein